MDSLIQIFRQMGGAKIGVMVAVLVALLLFFVIMSLQVTSPSMKLLYADLSAEDASSISVKLEEANIPYNVSPDGSRIKVAENDVGKARLLLADEGLPNGGSMGYEIFDEKSGFGTTNFVQNINKVRALEGELARTIAHLEPVKTARVHLVLPQKEMFTRDRQESTASVYVSIRPGNVLDKGQVASIQSLVASGVPDLKPDKVTVIDQNGNLLAQGDGGDGSMVSVKEEERQRNYEQALTRKIEDQIGRVVGYGRVRAAVTAELNFDRISTNEELYDPETQVIRSSQISEETSTLREAGDEEVTVGNNLPGVGGDVFGQTQPSEESNRVEEITNYEISKTIRTVTREIGEVKKLSVSVLIDGRYIENEEGEKIYEPRSEQEIEQIETLVKSAIGYDVSRGDTLEIVNMQFAKIETETETPDEMMLMGFEKGQLVDLIQVAIIVGAMVLVVLLVIQPLIGRILSAEPASAEIDDSMNMLSSPMDTPRLNAPQPMGRPVGNVSFPQEEEEEEEDDLIDVHKIEGKVKASTVKRVEDLVDNYPNETVSVIRNWMSQDGQ